MLRATYDGPHCSRRRPAGRVLGDPPQAASIAIDLAELVGRTGLEPEHVEKVLAELGQWEIGDAQV